jgi:hypothetical protein
MFDLMGDINRGIKEGKKKEETDGRRGSEDARTMHRRALLEIDARKGKIFYAGDPLGNRGRCLNMKVRM